MDRIIAIKYLTNSYQNIEEEKVVLEQSYFSKYGNDIFEFFVSHTPENDALIYAVDSNGYIYSMNSSTKKLTPLSPRKVTCKILTRESEILYNQSERYNERKKLTNLDDIIEFANKRAEDFY